MYRKIPFTEVDLYLKQLNPSEFNELGIAATNYLFKGYIDAELFDKKFLHEYILKMQKICGPNFSFDPSPARRFAGDSSMPRGCFFTIAQDESGFDDGVLVSELRTYYNPSNSGMVQIFDQTNPRNNQLFKELEFPFGEYNIVLVFLPLGMEPHKFAREYTVIPEPFLVFLPLLIQRRRLTRVLDLRLPDVANWFAQTLSRLEWYIGGTTIKAFPYKPPLQSFREILPTMLAQELGGGGFSKVAGLWCRKYGVQALIYPSARTDCGVHIMNNQVLSYNGWNLVDYSGAKETKLDALFDTTPDWPTNVGILPVDFCEIKEPIWFDDVRIEYMESGSSRGSWHVKGLKKRRDAIWRFNMAISLIKERSEAIAQDSIETLVSWLATAPTADLMGATSNLIFEALMGIPDAMKNISILANDYELKGDNELACCLRDLLKCSLKR
ncbi:MAG: hypothetical protein K8S27_05670 [Candidatus Omnitrophica bacterium]|nr:hypothetical protein [Candidatus Omnitrophota bacterium]